jgi:hypothetical protein
MNNLYKILKKNVLTTLKCSLRRFVISNSPQSITSRYSAIKMKNK